MVETKTVQIDDDVYEELKKRKTGTDSFNDVVKNVIKEYEEKHRPKPKVIYREKRGNIEVEIKEIPEITEDSRPKITDFQDNKLVESLYKSKGWLDEKQH